MSTSTFESCTVADDGGDFHATFKLVNSAVVIYSCWPTLTLHPAALDQEVVFISKIPTRGSYGRLLLSASVLP